MEKILKKEDLQGNYTISLIEDKDKDEWTVVLYNRKYGNVTRTDRRDFLEDAELIYEERRSYYLLK